MNHSVTSETRKSARKPTACGTNRSMSKLKRLQDARTTSDLARLLGFAPNKLAFLLYKLPSEAKYHQFEIPKRGGGTRRIKAPNNALALAQKRLADLLYECMQEMGRSSPPRKSLAHGFERSRSILTNAAEHRARRYVLNADLKDFFPSINFGRVRAFFIKDRHFNLDPRVATALAQLSCHENELPQGSPCSPPISNLIGHLLDVRLARLAKACKCHYSRYADDLTFSTNQKSFPDQIAVLDEQVSQKWHLAQPLIEKISRAGFVVNEQKTRMQIRGSRQIVTGLIVNEKINVTREYYLTARAMCHEYFRSGCYFRNEFPSQEKPDFATPEGAKHERKTYSSPAPLSGILSHIYHVKNQSDKRSPSERKKNPTAVRKLFFKFLFHEKFIAINKPVILTEGKTDAIYLKSAIRYLPRFHPKLGKTTGKQFSTAVSFLNFTRNTHDILQLGGGTGDLKFFILNYSKNLGMFNQENIEFPVIILIDNDEGAKDIFAMLKKNFDLSISLSSRSIFYHIHRNLYLIKVPEIGTSGMTCIEDLFDSKLRAKPLGGKVFNPKLLKSSSTEYGKTIFAEKVVKPNANKIDFSGFEPLLGRLEAALDHYSAQPTSVTPKP